MASNNDILRPANGESGERLTIHDVARHLGISARTISRVMNDGKGVSQQTRDLVLQKIQEMGYAPHSGARSLRRQKLDGIGVTLGAAPEIVPVSHELLAWMFRELYRIFGSEGEFLVFDLAPPAQQGTRDYARGLWQQRFGALVIVGALRCDDQILRRVHASGRPYVACARLDEVPEANTAAVDYEQAAYESTRELIRRGHRRIGMLKALDGYQPGRERERGYTRALEEAGLPLDRSLMRPVGFSASSVSANLHGLLADREVTGIIDASGAQSAAALREGIARSGRAATADFEMVVWSYTFMANILDEAVAHVWLPVREAASQGMERLAAWVKSGERDNFQFLYPPRLYQPAKEQEIPAPRNVFNIDR